MADGAAGGDEGGEGEEAAMKRARSVMDSGVSGDAAADARALAVRCLYRRLGRRFVQARRVPENARRLRHPLPPLSTNRCGRRTRS